MACSSFTDGLKDDVDGALAGKFRSELIHQRHVETKACGRSSARAKRRASVPSQPGQSPDADPETVRRYDEELDAAFEQARHDQNLTALMQAVRAWSFQPTPLPHPDTH